MTGLSVVSTLSSDTATVRADWHVLLTKSRQEKALAEDLASLKIEHYLPLIQVVRYHRNRKVNVEIPMFTGYLFLHGTIEDAYRADRTNRVARIIEVFDQTRLGYELHGIRLATQKKAQLEVYAYLRKGMTVQVQSGPFKGLRGIVEDRKANRLFLQVEMLGVAVGMEIDGSLLEPIE